MRKFIILFGLLSLMACITSCNSKDKPHRAVYTGERKTRVENSQNTIPVLKETDSSHTASVQEISSPDEYKIINSEKATMTVKGVEIEKMNYTIEIPSEYSASQLENIARHLAKTISKDKNVFVEFYLPSQPKNGPNYGISKRINSNFETQINYVAPPKEEPQVKTPYDGASKIFGKWALMGATGIIYQKNGRCYMVNHYGGSNYGEPQLFYKTTFRGKTAFKNAEDPSDMYVIESDGSLGGYYEGDLGMTFGRIQ